MVNTKCIKWLTLLCIVGCAYRLCPKQLARKRPRPATTFGKLPIKELTVFKDGHACVAQEGELPIDDKGNVVMDYLPTPVIGAFWPYSRRTGRAGSPVWSRARNESWSNVTALDIRGLARKPISARKPLSPNRGLIATKPQLSICPRAAPKNWRPQVRPIRSSGCREKRKPGVAQNSRKASDLSAWIAFRRSPSPGHISPLVRTRNSGIC